MGLKQWKAEKEKDKTDTKHKETVKKSALVSRSSKRILIKAIDTKMMEETVPLASNNTRASSSSNIQQRSTAGAPRNTNSTPSTNNATTSTGASSTQQQEDDARSTRRRNALSTSNILSSLLSPTFLLSRAIIIITFLLKILLYPVRKASYHLFPLREFDGLTTEGVADKAAQTFVAMFLKTYIKPRYGDGRSATGDGGSNVDGDSSANGDSNDLELLTTCPFTPNGYTHTIQSIANQTIQHRESITNISSSSNNSNSFYDDIPPSPPLLLIYLHSPFHSLTPTFCHSKLCSNRILKYLNDATSNHKQLICWGGSIHTADGKNVQSMMNVTAYPFLALVRVTPQSSSSSSSSSNNTVPTKTNLETYFRMEGHKLSTVQSSTLYTYLQRSIQDYSNQQNEELSRIISRQEEINLRSEQDREYREAVEEAQRREREKEEEERRKEEEERLKLEELNRVVKEKENKLNEAKRILELHGNEPDKSDKSIKCAQIRLTLPSGKKIVRRFRAIETIDTVKSFLVLYFEEKDAMGESGKIENFQLNCNFPRKALVNGSATLEEEGLCPQAVIMVQDLDA